MSGLDGKVVLITGASRGIGEAMAKRFAARGSSLSLAGRDVEKLEQVATSCKENGTSTTKVLSIQGDITKKEDRESLIQKTVDHYGRLDVLINNAGIARFCSVGSASPEQIQEVFEINVSARMALTQLAIPHLKKCKGNIINVSSTLSRHAYPMMGVYCMSHASMDMYTQCLALELAEFGIRVNSINPGYVDTGIARYPGMPLEGDEQYKAFLEYQKTLHPMGRHAEPSEVAAAAVFLASDDASFVTGDVMHVDGGRHAMAPGYTVSQGAQNA